MSRFTPGALQSVPDEPSSEHVDCWQLQHKLPFNSGSPTWLQKRMDRPAAEERMAQLVKTLEAEVIPRLVEARRSAASAAQADGGPSPSPADVDEFVRLIVSPDEVAPVGFVAQCRRIGMSVETICLELLTPAARQLGVWWAEDICDFTVVTLGVGRLQQILQNLSPILGSEVAFPANARRVALVPAPGDQHTFGLSMVAEFFLTAGWDVMVGHGAQRDEASELVKQQWFDVIGFSVGSDSRLDWLTTCIKAVRAASCNPVICVLVGGPIFSLHPEYVDMVGADATSRDAKQAPIVAEDLVAELVRSLG